MIVSYLIVIFHIPLWFGFSLGLLILILIFLVYSYYRSTAKLKEELDIMRWEHKQREAKLEDSGKVKDRIISVLSHDVKSPLRFLNISISMMGKSLDKFSKEELKNHLIDLENSSNELYQLITEILDWAKQQTKGKAVTIDEFNVYDMIQSKINSNQTLINEGDLRFQIDIPEDLQLTNEKASIEIIVQNIIANTSKYAKGATVDIVAEAVDGGVSISFNDNGNGFDEKTIEAFENKDFKQINQSNPLDSTGLGLLIASELVSKCQGKIKIYNNDYNGAGVELFFPNREVPEKVD